MKKALCTLSLWVPLVLLAGPVEVGQPVQQFQFILLHGKLVDGIHGK